MTGIAIVMMIAALGLVWGGLALAVINLLKHPDATIGDED